MSEVVCDGTTFKCSHGSSPLKIKVSSSAGHGNTKPLANTTNHHFPPPGSQCQITSSPCSPDTQVVDPGQKPIQINAKPALGVNCKVSCSKGGAITHNSHAQTSAQHTTTTPPEQTKCSVIRADILSQAIAVRDNGKFIEYYNDQPHGRMGGTANGMHNDSFDCGGFVSAMFLRAGVSLKIYGQTEFPTTTGFGLLIDPDNGPFKETTTPQPGDLVFWPGKHIGIYEGKRNIADTADASADPAADTDHDHDLDSFISALHSDTETSVRSMTIRLELHPNRKHGSKRKNKDEINTKYKFLTFIKCIDHE